MALIICRLEESHLRKAFDCGDQALNEYLHRYAWQNQEKHLVGTTYVAAEEGSPTVVVGYYTLATSGIPSGSLHRFSVALSRLPYPEVPVVLLARLAVDHRFQRHGVGRVLIADALRRALEIGKLVGCRCLMVDAYWSAVDWYKRLGFVEIVSAPAGAPQQKMFIDLRTIQKAVEGPR